MTARQWWAFVMLAALAVNVSHGGPEWFQGLAQLLLTINMAVLIWRVLGYLESKIHRPAGRPE